MGTSLLWRRAVVARWIRRSARLHSVVLPRPVAARIGYAAGALDLFHAGRLNVLEHAKFSCDVLSAGIVSDIMLLLITDASPMVLLAERLGLDGAFASGLSVDEYGHHRAIVRVQKHEKEHEVEE